ncbi:hypothetical protein B566_EDAN009776 [Ephemera danica]|nr:hypothetical protein B566_EDAN009776 [Ephemera danica]
MQALPLLLVISLVSSHCAPWGDDDVARNEITSADEIPQEILDFYNVSTSELYHKLGLEFVPMQGSLLEENYETRVSLIFPGHDHCPEYIDALSSNFGLKNTGFTTKLNCDCDLEFFTCLREINSVIANKLGRIYFNLIGNDCFKEDFPIIGCNSYTVYSLPQYYGVNSSTESHITFNFKAIYPGTKWCGAGNIATNKNDLGQLVREDSCCRDHDTCADVIRPESSKYGLRNPSTSTRFACSCESKFYLCLKAIKSRVANQLGHVYFNVLGEDCFKKSNPIVGCRLSVPDKLM